MYKRGAEISTEADRLANFEAWVYAPFISREFFSGVRGGWDSEVSLTVYQGEGSSPSDLIFASDQSLPVGTSHTTQGTFAGNPFTLRWTALPGLRRQSESIAIWLSVLGMLGTLLLSALVTGLATLERRASELVVTRTQELERSRQLAEEAAQTAKLASAAK